MGTRDEQSPSPFSLAGLGRPIRYAISAHAFFPEVTPGRYLESLLRTSADIVQWREPALERNHSLDCLKRSRSIALEESALLVVSGDIDLALEAGIDGVHLKSFQPVAEAVRRRDEGDCPKLLIGRSVHSLQEAEDAAGEGADYVLLSPIFAPRSKLSSRPALGMEALAAAASRLPIPVIGLGGVDHGHWRTVASTKAAGLAGISWVRDELEVLLPC